MKLYVYEAYTASGELVHGSLSSLGEREAIDQLRAQGLFPSKVTVDTQTQDTGPVPKVTAKRQRAIPREEQALFFRQIALLLGSSVPLETALRSLANGEGSAGFKRLAARLAHGMQEGSTLADLLATYSSGFPLYIPAVIRSGENSGRLEDVCARLADHLESRDRQKASLLSALVYPIFVGGIALLVILVLTINLAPELELMLSDAGVPMPPLTRVVVSMGKSLTLYWPLWLGGLGSMLLLSVAASRHATTRDRIGGIVEKIPILGRFARLDNASRYLRTLALILQSRQTAIAATKGAAHVLQRVSLRNEADRVTQAVNEGEKLSRAIKALPFLPSIAVQMIEIGEDTADVGRMATRAADVIDSWLSTERARLATLLEPVLLIVVGGLVLLVALAVLLPIFDLQSSVNI